MIRRAEQEPHEFRAIVIAAILISMSIGSVATLRGDSVAWGSLVHRPLMFGAFYVAALVVGRRAGFIALTAWFGVLGLQYVYGGFNASYLLLRILRWMAAVFFLWSTVRLATSLYSQTQGDEAHQRS